MAVTEEKDDPWKNPEWFLLSAGKMAQASSYTEGKEPQHATEENVQTWWQAGANTSGEWLSVDLGQVYDVRAVQINFADDEPDIPCPGKIRGTTQARYIEENDYTTRWKLEGSTDGERYFVIEDKSEAKTDLPHDLVVRKEGIQVRYVRLTIVAVPYGQNRVFPVCVCSESEPEENRKFRNLQPDVWVNWTRRLTSVENMLWDITFCGAAARKNCTIAAWFLNQSIRSVPS